MTAEIHKKILENMQGGVISLDLQGRVTTFNPAAEQILGLKHAEVLGRTFAETFLELPGSDDFVQVVLDAICDSSMTHHKYVSFRSGSATRRLSVTTSFLFEDDRRNDASARVGVVAVFDDITEVERLRETVRAMATLRVEQLVHAHRERGHMMSKLDPLGLTKVEGRAELTPEYYGIKFEEMHDTFTVLWGNDVVSRPLDQILKAARRVYCDSVGIQYMHIDNPEIQSWLRERLEGPFFERTLSRDQQLRILRKLIDAEIFESFLQTKFRSSKRFSLEGAETLIPLLDQAIERSARDGAKQVIIGMSHRGRLNVIANILGIPAAQIFRRFEQLDSGEDTDNDGDVRFHLGMENDLSTSDGNSIRVSLCFNPSHLELVGPVAMGRARAKQDVEPEIGNESIVPIMIHGDAAFAGQGIVQETFNLSRLKAFSTGGSVHIILNNQIGFTTQPDQSRSTQYPSDVARMLQIPIFHVNGERPEAVNRVIRLALEFRRTWGRDVVIDMYCFRRRGHMEQDDPSFTQPILYQAIARQPSIRASYASNLLKLGQVSAEEAEAIAFESDRMLESELQSAQSLRASVVTRKHSEVANEPEPGTSVCKEQLVGLLERLAERPEDFDVHPKIAAMLRRRHRAAQGNQKIDWATGEMLAYATLLSSGVSVRLSGQDSERGTFAHRHAVLHDMKTGETHVPLARLSADGQSQFTICNSPLTEAAVMAFEFGYSIEPTSGLVIWEAQFGDFANMSQAIIDQFLVSSWVKWNQRSGLVLLLPHGLEGQGPEHSSARPERFLQLCANDNIEVVYLSSAGQVFHRLRQQGLAEQKRPLIAFTPKRLLQNAATSSTLEELCEGSFQSVIANAETPQPEQVLLCSGQIAADLITERSNRKLPVAVVRLDRLYPFPAETLARAVGEYPRGIPVTWVQEEPENMGAWRWIKPHLETTLHSNPISFVARPERASPATGSLAVHNREQQWILEQAFTPRTRIVPNP